MEYVETSEVIVRIPPSMLSDVDGHEIVGMLLDKSLAKKDYFRTKMKVLESKYGMDFDAFKQRLEKGKENFEEWDDLLLWEGYALAHREWDRKYEDLKRCMK